MYFSSARKGRLLSLTLLAVMLISTISFGAYPLPFANAQSNGNLISYGESLMGSLSGIEIATYGFEASANDVVEITVLGFGFNPSLKLLDNTQTQVLAENANEIASSNIELTYSIQSSGTYFIHVGSIDNSIGGSFGLTLNQGQRALPPGIPLSLGSNPQGSISNRDLPIVYDIAPNPNGVSTLQIRSLTGGYSPVVSILAASGESIFSMNNPRLLGFSVLLAPSNEPLKLVIELGSFVGTANFEVTLADGAIDSDTSEIPINSNPTSTEDNTIGLLSVPVAGCFLTVGQNTNIRQGGSTNHPIVAILGENKYLVVIGYNAVNSGWYQVQLPNGNNGWLASFVANTGGSCINLPTASYPPAPNSGNGSSPGATAEPNATAEPPQPPTTNTQFVQMRIVHSNQTLTGNVTYPSGVNVDFVSITYEWDFIDDPDDPPDEEILDDVEYELICTGEGVDQVTVSGGGLTSCNQTSTAFYSQNGKTTESISISADGQPGVNVHWELRIDARN